MSRSAKSNVGTTHLVYCTTMFMGGEMVRRVLLLAAILSALLVTGCGSSAGSESGAPKTPDDLLVSESDIRDAGKGKPAAALLGWWQALQFDDARTAYAFFAPGVTSEERLAAQLRVAGAPTLAMPEVEQAKIRDDRALLYTIVVSVTVGKGNKIDTISRRPVTFRMVRYRGGWKFTDNDFLAERATAAMAAQGAAEK